MLKDQDILCISSIDWDFIWQGHQEIMSALAANGNRVLFIENTGVRPPNLRDLPRLKKRIYNWLHSVKGIRKEQENLYIYAPLILPFPYSRIARWINKRLMVLTLQRWIKSVGFANPIIWTFLPTGLALDIMEEIDNKAVVYYCIDNFEASSPQAKRIKETENVLLQKADIVFVTSKNLYDSCSKYNKNVHIFPYGINMDVYEKAFSKHMEPPRDIADMKHPIVGYVGGVHKWIDFDLVKFLAERNMDKSFVFVGPLQSDTGEVISLQNVHFLQQKPYPELPSYISQFDVCIIPYRITDYTNNVYPTKINEYLSMGKPVVSTAMPEVEAFNKRNGGIVSIGRTNEEISLLLGRAIAEKPSAESRLKRAETAAKEGSWRVKIEEMCALIEKKILDREMDRSLKWKDNLLKLYKKSRKRLIPALGALLVLYFILFHTGLIWLAADQLKISEAPRKADCIVVFSGGVGESGKAGQGYEERVSYAVDLYKKGYADNLIFSSGYKYFFKETVVMKSLAMSLGVPERAIILEDKAENTYRNVKYSSDILRGRGWNNILLVSSPYHMRRVAMVFKKIAGGVDAAYVPIPESSFYSHNTKGFFSKKASFQQVRSILHEYLAMAYYWWKGWI